VHPELKLLPEFRLLRAAEGSYEGVFDIDMRMGKKCACYLISSDEDVIAGSCIGYDLTDGSAVFVLNDKQDAGYLVVGDDYRFLDNYWGERVALVLDRSLKWSRREFTPQDAVKQGNEYSKASSSSTGEIIKDGWEHEHCSICWEEIAQHAENFGYVNQRNDWVCEKCYSEYVGPNTISFLNEQVVKQIRGLGK
jgi:hypothetical protein